MTFIVTRGASRARRLLGRTGHRNATSAKTAAKRAYRRETERKVRAACMDARTGEREIDIDLSTDALYTERDVI